MFGKKQVAAVVDRSVEIMTNPVERAARLAQTVAVPTNVDAEIVKLQSLRAELLPIEQQTIMNVESRIDVLRAAKELPYKRLSLEPLSWRDKKGWPVLAMYSIASPIMRLVGSSSFGEDHPKLPSPIRQAFRTNLNVDWTSMLTSTFTGVIPAKVRVEIKEARPYFKDELYIIAEAAWVETKRAADPLVVGYRAGALWLVAQFDLTDIEKYVISEFPG